MKKSNTFLSIISFVKLLFNYNFVIALEAIFQNKLRAVLTSLGIVCGVASVIAMLAIGKGAEQEIVEKMKLLGSKNIIITGLLSEQIEKKEQEASDDKSKSKSQGKEEKKKAIPGMKLRDFVNIEKVIPGIEIVSPEIELETTVMTYDKNKTNKIIGITNNYFAANNFKIADGSIFLEKHFLEAEPVCIIGPDISSKFFPGKVAIGQKIKCGNTWLKVIGVLEAKTISKTNLQNLGIRNYNEDILLPINSVLLRYQNQDLITKASLQRNRRSRRAPVKKEETPHQISRIVISVKDNKQIFQIAEIIGKMLQRKHNAVNDYEIIVPEQLLEQEQNTKRIFNIVLGAIASISLLVGGIGIMNIMLASVMERTKEIGIRLAVGAKQHDILQQFLLEAVSISLVGGIIGIIIGVSTSVLIEKTTEIKTILSYNSILLSFFVSISVGLIFGITPAKKASEQNPIDLLRYE